MGWLGLLRTLLGLTASLTSYLKDKQLIEAGEAQAIAEGLHDAQVAVAKARRARRAAVDKFNKRDGLPDEDDPNLRD